MKNVWIMLSFMTVGAMLWATPAPAPIVIYEDDFNDGTFNTDYWTVVFGTVTANATTPGVYYGDGFDSSEAFGTLSFSTDEYTEIRFDLYKLVVEDLGYPASELANITFSYDLTQTNGTPAFFRVWSGFSYNGNWKPKAMLPTGAADGSRGPDAATDGWIFSQETSFGSFYGGSFNPEDDQAGAVHPGIEKYHRLNRGFWKWQRLSHEFNVDEYVTMKLFQDYNLNGEFVYVAGGENYHPDSGLAPWPYPDTYTIMNRDGVVSWFVDNVTIQLNNPYWDWNLVLEENFDTGVIDPMWTTSGIWTVAGNTEEPLDSTLPWSAMAGKMASSDPNAWFKASLPATTPGELVALSFEVEQSNGSDGDFPVFFGFVDAESNDYYVQYASPALTYGGVSGAMVMQGVDSDGNGTDPFEGTNGDWWNFGAGVDGKRLDHQTSTRIDMIINPWDNYPDGSVSVYFNGELAAKWTNFRGIFSFNEVFFGIRNSDYEENLFGAGVGGYVPTWNFDNIKIYTRPAQCGDVGHYNPFDFNKDCVVNLADFAMFAAEWLSCTKPDINCFQ